MNSKETSFETVTPSVREVCSAVWEYWESNPLRAELSTQSSLYRALFLDIAQHFPNFVLADFSYLHSRLASEGDKFYLETLPLLGRAFEHSLISLEPFKVPDGWRLQRGTRLPKFCFQLFSQLFSELGVPLYDWQWSKKTQPSQRDIAVKACQFLRQLCGMFSKVETLHDVDESSDESLLGGAQKISSKTMKAFNSFIERSHKNMSLDVFRDDLVRGAVKEAHRLLRVVFSGSQPTLDELRDFERNPWGRQGPGAVAGREVGCEKWSFKKWPGLPTNLFMWRDGLSMDAVFVENQPDARLCAVPKDFRGPRMICIEPKENQFAQQGLMDILYRHVHACALTRRSISFLDTEPSQRLCYNNEFATLDLKDASDLISLKLARLVLPRWIFRLATRYRSRNVFIRELNTRVKTNCLATMGNATCFPLETLVFWALSLGTLIHIRDSYHPRQQKHLNVAIRVFGDDIIVPLWGFDSVAHVLETCGLVVNNSKSCSFSPVRESCGEWVFLGQPVRVYKPRTASVYDWKSYVQWRDMKNSLEQGFRKDIPALYVEISGICDTYFRSCFPNGMRIRWNKSLQRTEVYAPTLVQVGRLSELSGICGLYAWHVQNDRTPFLKGARLRVKMRWQDMHQWIDA